MECYETTRALEWKVMISTSLIAVLEDSPGAADRVQFTCARLTTSARPRGCCCALTSTPLALRLPPNDTANQNKTHAFILRCFYVAWRFRCVIIHNLSRLFRCQNQNAQLFLTVRGVVATDMSVGAVFLFSARHHMTCNSRGRPSQIRTRNLVVDF